MIVWVTIGSTESGDPIGPYVWNHEPTRDEIMAILMRDIPDEVEADCISSLQTTSEVLIP